jgi:hypothetical protein
MAEYLLDVVSFVLLFVAAFAFTMALGIRADKE